MKSNQRVNMPRHPFHIVDPSPWPILTAINCFGVAMGFIRWFHDKDPRLLGWRIAGLLYTLALWWRDVIRERTFMGHHTTYVARGLRTGMLLFLLSEAIFFFGFFWAFFHSALRPAPEIGCTWPPVGIEPISPWAMPIANTAILLASGCTLTWAHHGLLEANRKEALHGLAISIILGVVFTRIQLQEYRGAHFTIADGIYGSCFYMLTGFHGLHVIIGTVFLSVNWWRTFRYHFSSVHHLGFEFGAWYWHFVDVIWILLYLCLYWWGGL